MKSAEEQIKSNGHGIVKFISVLSIDLPLQGLKEPPVGSRVSIISILCVNC